ncbi:MAG: translation initiation factor IF-2 [Thermoanaerobaculia bacterium]|nr:translation initiation factor IF-2 [Thermoanaerobaculia bacterium]
MGKIRVTDLATMMGVSHQDLVFKLRSIGVRVEGEEAAVESEILQAILAGKKLASPREVIMDDSAPEGAPPAARRTGVAAPPTPAARRTTALPPLRPTRPRTLIQKVEPKIKTLPATSADKLAPGAGGTDPMLAAFAAAESTAPAATGESPADTASPSAVTAASLAPAAAAAVVTPVPASGPAATEVRPASASPAISAGAPSTAPTLASASPTPPPPAAVPGAPPVPPARPVRGAVLVHRATEPYRPTPPPARPGYRPSGPGTRPGGPPGSRPSGPPGSRPGGPPGSRPSGPPGSRPPYAGGAGRPPMGGPSRPGGPRPPSSMPPPSSPGSSKRGDQRGPDSDKKKSKKGRKTTIEIQTADIRSLRGSLVEIEDVVDQSVVPSGSQAARSRRRKETRGDQDPEVNTIRSGRTLEDGPMVISEGMTLRDFADRLQVKAKDLIALLVQRGIMANINFIIEPEFGIKLVKEFGLEAKVMTFEQEVQSGTKPESESGPAENSSSRAPVVTIMGHVDHGKTSLLDKIRSSKITEGEFGGITQHIGAYHVDVNNRQIVFLDTPGHEAFTMMRARGARVTDIVVLVVAADDGVMPQTAEAIDHARAAGVPIVVALNKIDKANANPDRVKQQLADRGLAPEDWGGNTVVVPVSAIKGTGINELLEMILLTADIQDLKANPERAGQGIVLEARKETGRGIIATVLVQNGTLKVGDVFVSGSTWGRVRSMSDDRGKRANESGPATAAEVTGFTDVPEAGDTFQVVPDEQKARSIVEFRQQESRKKDLVPTGARLSLQQLFSQIEKGEVKDLAVVLKADVQGSLEVLRDAIEKIGTAKVKTTVLHSGVGAITTNDVLLASASKAIIVGFNIRPERNAVELAEKEQVEIRLYTVIYELLDDLRNAMVGLLEPTFKEVSKGRAEVREIYRVPKVGTIAGCHVLDGVIPRSAPVRVIRDGRVVVEGKIVSLKRFKDDASEVRAGFDCGIGLDRFQDMKPGDIIEAFAKEEIAPTLN